MHLNSSTKLNTIIEKEKISKAKNVAQTNSNFYNLPPSYLHFRSAYFQVHLQNQI